MLTQVFIDEMKERMLQEQVRLTRELSAVPAHTEMGENEDDGLGELELDEVNQDLSERIRNDLAKIDKALSKIAHGTYGTDDNGVQISEERLRALPWADRAI